MAIIAQNTDYGTGFVRFLEPALKDAGVDVTESITYDSNATSFDTEVEQVAAAKPDGVALIGYPEDGGLVLKGMIQKDLGPDKVSIYVTDGMQDNALYKAVDSSDPASTEGLRARHRRPRPPPVRSSSRTNSRSSLPTSPRRSTRPRPTTAWWSSPWPPSKRSPTPRSRSPR